MKNSILNTHINIYKCKDHKSTNEVLKFYKNYEIINYIHLENVKTIKTITGYNIGITSLLLKNKKLISASNDKTLRIYNTSKDYRCDKIINKHNSGIISICQLDDDTIVSCSYNTIMIGDYTINNAHDEAICKVISLNNNRIASCSFDKKIKIWKSNPPYSDTPRKYLMNIMNVLLLLYK